MPRKRSLDRSGWGLPGPLHSCGSDTWTVVSGRLLTFPGIGCGQGWWDSQFGACRVQLVELKVMVVGQEPGGREVRWDELPRAEFPLPCERMGLSLHCKNHKQDCRKKVI